MSLRRDGQIAAVSSTLVQLFTLGLQRHARDTEFLERDLGGSVVHPEGGYDCRLQSNLDADVAARPFFN